MKDVGDRTRDRAFLAEAAALAWKGRGGVEPNPLVGALVVRNGRVAGWGYHREYGGPHAEIHALRRAGASAAGAVLYVTLEPCSSRGKTPPCTEAVRAARVRRVVAGAVDPDPRHRGKGLAMLSAAGIRAELLPEAGCEALRERFRRHRFRGRPHVILKWAMTLDGRIAARDGTSRWISGEASRRKVHRLRGHVDAVLVGARTAGLDAPRLNARLRGVPCRPARVVFDPRLTLPLTSSFVRSAGEDRDREGFPLGPAWILAAAGVREGKGVRLARLGLEVVRFTVKESGERALLRAALRALYRRGVRRLLVEGGARLFTGLVEHRLADQAVVFVGPRIVGGRAALAPVLGHGRAPMEQALDLEAVSFRSSGRDGMFTGFFPWHGS